MYPGNYGYIPNTITDDGDPVDVCDIGSKVHPSGSIIKVKVLGTLAMIDEGETDWKMLAIDVTDELAPKLNDVEDIETHMPGFLAATIEWFKIYKMPDGKPANEFAFNGEPKNREFAEKIIAGTHESWKKLMSGSSNPMGLSIINTSLDNTASVDQEQAKGVISEVSELPFSLKIF